LESPVAGVMRCLQIPDYGMPLPAGMLKMEPN